MTHFRNLARNDLYFLIRYICHRGYWDTQNPRAEQWLYDRCREYAQNPDGYLDLWAREHYKSTIITFGGTLQDILKTHGDGAIGQEVTAGIFSHTGNIAKGFLLQIKRELEENAWLRELFPEVIWEKPDRDAPMWSEKGIIVRRSGNPREGTVEASGLTDGMPTGRHYNLLVYDDVVTRESVGTPEQIKKTTESWFLSLYLGTEGGRVRYIGTRYHYNDTYRTIIKERSAIPRIHAATHDGSLSGYPIMLSAERWAAVSKDPYITACQMLQEPKADKAQGLQREWLAWWEPSNWKGMNVYMLVDPANEKNKKSDYTAICVIGLGMDGNKYWIDGIRDRLNMKERCDAVIEFHKKYTPRMVGYEKYGMQTDIDYIKRECDLLNYRFGITELGGSMGKNDRIRRLVPDLAQHKWYWPKSLFKTLYDGSGVDIVEQTLIEEFDPFPVPIHDDMLDCMSRIYDADLATTWPRGATENDRYTSRAKPRRASSWATR